MSEYEPEMMDPLAVEIAGLYVKNPLLTLNLIASQLDANVHDVTYIVDAYEIVDGEPIHRGPGKGGNWLPPENQVSMEPLPLEEVGEDTGQFRWPGGSLQSIQFDVHNEEHRAIVGLTDDNYNRLVDAQSQKP